MGISRKKAEEILTGIQKDVDEAANEVHSRMDSWLERMAFYRGLHYTVSGGQFHTDEDGPAGEARETHNFIPSFVKAAVATRIKHFPNPQVPAVDGDQKSLSRAVATERLLRSFVDDDVLAGEEFINALTSGAIVGASWLKAYWDPFDGKAVPSEQAVEEVSFDMGDGSRVTETFEREKEKDIFGQEIQTDAFEGKVKVGFVDLFDGWADPTASKASEMRYWVHRKVRPAEEMQRHFPKDYFGKELHWTGTALDPIWTAKQALTQSDAEGELGGGQKHGDMAALYEYWGAANEDYPNGLMCVFSEDKILHIGPCPYIPARLPAVFMPSDNIMPGSLYPLGVVEHLIQPQKTMNRAESKIRETMDRMLNPHILVPHAADVDEEIFGEIGGQVIKYNAGYAPHILHSPEVPSSMFNISANMVARMREISTYSDISRGDVPGRVESGRAIAFLQENESDIRTADVKIYKQAVLGVMKQCLWLARQFYADGRMIRALGEEAWTVYEFMSEEYDWDADLAPEPFSGAPNSRALRWSETIEAFQMGLYDDEKPGAKDVRKILDMDHANRSTTDKDAEHRSLSRMENNQVLQRSKGKYAGPLNPVREFHNHEAHLDEHNRFRNAQDYLELVPEARNLLDEHCEDHEDMLSGQMQDYAANQQMLEPGQGGAGATPGIASPADGGAPVGQPGMPIPQK